MKKILTVCIVLSLCLMFAACGNKSDVNVPAGYKIASNEESPYYTLIVPDKWVVDTQSGTTTAYYKDDLSGMVIATISASSAVPENQNITLDTYFDSYSEELNRIFDVIEPTETTQVSEGEVDEPSEKIGEDTISYVTTVLDGEAARRYIYKAAFNGVEYTFWQEICMHQGRIYTLTFSTPSQFYDKLSDNMTDVLHLFKFTK